jgi:hypothetical protein
MIDRMIDQMTARVHIAPKMVEKFVRAMSAE